MFPVVLCLLIVLSYFGTSYSAQKSCVISQRESKQVLVGVKDSVSEQLTWDLWLKKWH